MYLSTTTHSLRAVSDVAATTNEPQFTVSYQDVTSSGMTFPQLSNQGDLNGASIVTMVSAPAVSTTRQITEITICNTDTVNHTITIYKEDSLTSYVLNKIILLPNQTIHWSRDDGYKILDENENINYRVLEYTSNSTYIKKSNVKTLYVVCIGGGGGGASGRRGAAGTERSGGTGACGGFTVAKLFFNYEINDTESIVVGMGGAGAPGQTLDDTDGIDGQRGGDTSFGKHILAAGGFAAVGGQQVSQRTAATPSLINSISYPANPALIYSPPRSGNGATSSTSNAANTQGYATCNSGGGQGITAANVAGTQTMSGGGRILTGNVVISGANQRVKIGQNGADNVDKIYLLNNMIFTERGFGTGGSGGSHDTNINGTNGGNYGAGGGSGAGVLNGTTSGAGGNGGGGLCVILEIY
jgi:hypothetical protein